MFRKRAQSLTEYSICLAIILIALITMNVYVKRGLQGRYYDTAKYTYWKVTKAGFDAIGNDSTLSGAEKQAKTVEFVKNFQLQYEPDYKESSYTNTMGRKIEGTTIKVGGNFRRDLPLTEKDKQGQDKLVNYMSVGGESKENASAKPKNESLYED